jgi:hypothetical protein
VVVHNLSSEKGNSTKVVYTFQIVVIHNYQLYIKFILMLYIPFKLWLFTTLGRSRILFQSCIYLSNCSYSQLSFSDAKSCMCCIYLPSCGHSQLVVVFEPFFASCIYLSSCGYSQLLRFYSIRSPVVYTSKVNNLSIKGIW